MNTLDQLIFFVTSRCNSKCRHCFNWHNLNNKMDLSLLDIENISKKLPKINNLLISGGEPFLRNDLPEIINIFVKNNDIKTVSIPTNGLLTDNIVKISEEIVKISELELVNINFSLDGRAEIHNYVRGIENNYAITRITIKKLDELKKKNPKLKILINSVIIPANANEVTEFSDLVNSWPEINNHYFELLRHNSKEEFDKIKIDFEFFEHLLYLQYNKYKREISMNTKNPIKSFLKKVLFLGRNYLIYRQEFENYVSQKDWKMPCTAGKNIMVINDDGSLSPCELRPKRFNLLAYNSWSELNKSPDYQKELKCIKADKCFCTHSCFLNSSFSSNKKMNYYMPSFPD